MAGHSYPHALSGLRAFGRMVPNRNDKKYEITNTDDAIDRLVYELYGLTEEEIRIVDVKI